MSDQLELFGGESFGSRKPRQQPRKAAPRTPPKFNLFLAVLPDRFAAEQALGIGSSFLKEHRTSGRLRPLSKLHVSLNGGGFDELPEDVLEKFSSAMKRAAEVIVPHTPCFEITFDRLSTFGYGNGDRPLVLTQDKEDDDSNAELKRLYEAILEADRAIFGPMHKSRFLPHMTLLYGKHQVQDQKAGPLSWTAREVVLILSERGADKYQILGQWPLRAC